jgi:PAS domain-containing protein
LKRCRDWVCPVCGAAKDQFEKNRFIFKECHDENNKQNGAIQEINSSSGRGRNANEAFVTIDQEHRVIFFNQAAKKFSGIPARKCGKDLDIILTSRCSPNHHKAVARYLKTKERS